MVIYFFPVDILMTHLLDCHEVYILTLPLIIWGRRASHDGVTMPVVDSFVDWFCQDIGGFIIGADGFDDDLSPLNMIPKVMTPGSNVRGAWTPLMYSCHLHCPTVVFKYFASDGWCGVANVESRFFQFLEQLYDGNDLPGGF